MSKEMGGCPSHPFLDVRYLDEITRDERVRLVCSIIEKEESLIADAYEMYDKKQQQKLNEFTEKYRNAKARKDECLARSYRDSDPETAAIIDNMEKMEHSVSHHKASIMSILGKPKSACTTEDEAQRKKVVYELVTFEPGTQPQMHPLFATTDAVYICRNCPNNGKTHGVNDVSRHWDAERSCIYFLCCTHYKLDASTCYVYGTKYI